MTYLMGTVGSYKRHIANRIVIPRQICRLIERDVSRFGFDSPELQERFDLALSMRKDGIARTRPGGKSGILRAPYAHGNLKHGRYSVWSRSSPISRANKDPNQYYKGIALRARSLDEGKSIYRVLARGLAEFRAEKKRIKCIAPLVDASTFDKARQAKPEELDGIITYTMKLMRDFRASFIQPEWNWLLGSQYEQGSDEWLDACEIARYQMGKFHLDTRQISTQEAEEFNAVKGSKSLREKTAQAMLQIHRPVVWRAYMHSEREQAPWVSHWFDYDGVTRNIWDWIVHLDFDHTKRAVRVPVSASDLDELDRHVTRWLADFQDEDQSIGDYAGLLLTKKHIDQARRDLFQVVNVPENSDTPIRIPEGPKLEKLRVPMPLAQMAYLWDHPVWEKVSGGAWGNKGVPLLVSAEEKQEIIRIATKMMPVALNEGSASDYQVVYSFRRRLTE